MINIELIIIRYNIMYILLILLCSIILIFIITYVYYLNKNKEHFNINIGGLLARSSKCYADCSKLMNAGDHYDEFCALFKAGQCGQSCSDSEAARIKKKLCDATTTPTSTANTAAAAAASATTRGSGVPPSSPALEKIDYSVSKLPKCDAPSIDSNKSISTPTINPNINISQTEDGLNEYGIPINLTEKNDIAYISVVASDELIIYVDRAGNIDPENIAQLGGYIGKITSVNKIFRFKINDIKPNNKIYFLNRNSGMNTYGHTYFLGHIFINGKVYPTNNEYFKIVAIESSDIKSDNKSSLNTFNGFDKNIGGRRLGCYKDDGTRKLPFAFNNTKSISYQECNEIAKRRNHTFFALQDGGRCWTGSDEERMKSLGKTDDSECAEPNLAYPNAQTGGGSFRNDVHLTYGLPQIRECGNLLPEKLSNDYSIDGLPGTIRGKIREESQIIKPAIGPNCNNNTHNRWIIYRFSTSPCLNNDTPLDNINRQVTNIDSLIKYCPDSNYVEFNPSACSDPTSTYKCKQTPNRGYYPDNSICENKVDILKDSKSVFDLFQNTINHIDYLVKTKNDSYNKNKNHIDNFKILFDRCMTMSGQLTDKERASDNPRVLINQVNEAINKETNMSDQTLSSSGMVLQDIYKHLINTARIIIGQLNMSNLPCPCNIDDDGLIKCGPC